MEQYVAAGYDVHRDCGAELAYAAQLDAAQKRRFKAGAAVRQIYRCRAQARVDMSSAQELRKEAPDRVAPGLLQVP